jgi:NDP-sugar pyrophosphorylase family protein
MLDFHQTQRAAATMAVREFSMQVPYGVIEHDETDTALVRAIVEKPVHQVFVNAGIYLLEPKALALVEKGKALDMPVLFERMIADGQQVRSFPLREYWLDIGRIDDFHRARAEYDEVFP